MLHCEQIRAGRALLAWSQAELADRAGVSEMTIRRLESRNGIAGGTVNTVLRIQKALEAAGVLFIMPIFDEGPGVKLVKSPVTRRTKKQV